MHATKPTADRQTLSSVKAPCLGDGSGLLPLPHRGLSPPTICRLSPAHGHSLSRIPLLEAFARRSFWPPMKAGWTQMAGAGIRRLDFGLGPPFQSRCACQRGLRQVRLFKQAGPTSPSGPLGACRSIRSGFERPFFRLAASGGIDDRTNIACFAVFARRKNGSLSGRRRSCPTKPNAARPVQQHLWLP